MSIRLFFLFLFWAKASYWLYLFSNTKCLSRKSNTRELLSFSNF